MVLALAACATQPVPPAEAPVAKPAPLPTIEFPPAPPKIVLVDPFQGAAADLEPLPPSPGDLWDRIARGYKLRDMTPFGHSQPALCAIGRIGACIATASRAAPVL